MNKNEIIQKIENFAPPELTEKWDCSGWVVEVCGKQEFSKVMLCLTVTEDVIAQAHEQNCDLIISHHPLFLVPFEWHDISIYSAHTNMDRTSGGTTDTLIKKLGLKVSKSSDFLRYVETKTTVLKFAQKLRQISPNLRYINNKNINNLQKIAFCAGSGTEFLNEAFENVADALVTGDLKFHTAVESPIVIFDIGHFESEILILDVFEKLLKDQIETVRANEKSPFLYLS